MKANGLVRATSILLAAMAAGAGLAVPSSVLAQQQAPAYVPSGESPSIVTLAPDDLLGSNLIDLELTGSDHRRVGEIEDVVFDGERRVRAFVVAVGEPRTDGIHHVAIAATAVRLSRDNTGKWRAETDVSREVLATAPQAPYRNGFNAAD